MKFLISLIPLLLLAESIKIGGGTYIIPEYHSFYVSHSSESITIAPFSIDKYEVSNREFEKKNIYADDLNLPVTHISYDEALNFCQKKGANLPTSEQWLIAASFEDGTFYPYSTQVYPIMDSNNVNVIKEYASELEDEGFGLFNDVVDVNEALIGNNNIVGMLGNVWEIVLSDGDFVELKGGSFYNANNVELLNNFVSTKVLKSQLSDYEHIGFRCVYK